MAETAGERDLRFFKEELPWDEKAKKNPLYTVMSDERFLGRSDDFSSWSEEDLGHFFEKGKYIFNVFLAPVIRNMGLKREEALIVDYGCGMGRILRAVRNAGFKCAGIDISPTMIGHCRRMVPDVENLSLLDENGNSQLRSESADFVYSFVVLQHIPDLSRVRKALEEMCRILKPGGLLKLQFLTLDLPYPRKLWHERKWVYNFEKSSLILKWTGTFFGYRPDWEWYSHNYWVGVPLSCRLLEEMLMEFRTPLLGLEKHLGSRKRFAWAIAQKVSG